MSSDRNAWGMSNHPTVWGLATVILLALGVLAVLRHLFGSIRIEAGAS